MEQELIRVLRRQLARANTSLAIKTRQLATATRSNNFYRNVYVPAKRATQATLESLRRIDANRIANLQEQVRSLSSQLDEAKRAAARERARMFNAKTRIQNAEKELAQANRKLRKVDRVTRLMQKRVNCYLNGEQPAEEPEAEIRRMMDELHAEEMAEFEHRNKPRFEAVEEPQTDDE